MTHKLTRPDGTVISAYAPGDGDLSFAASYNGRATNALTITELEARQVCPDGFTLYRDGPYWRARVSREMVDAMIGGGV